MTSDFLTIREAADRLGVSETTIRTWARRKRDPLPHMRCGRVVRIPSDGLEAWAAAHTIGATQ